MALPLPAIQSVGEGAEFGRTVYPFLLQLINLPAELVEAGLDTNKLRETYMNTNPFITALALTLLSFPLFVILSEITKNYSQVDRWWGILPALHNAHFAIWARMAGLPTNKIDTIALFSAFWGARLTFNFWRKGGYSIGSEDYRWEILRSQIASPTKIFLFNVLFISLCQPLLLLLITSPTYIFLVLSQLPEGTVFGIPDLIFSRLIIFFILLEMLADEQQWKFQSVKRVYLEKARIPDKYKARFTTEDLDRGFVVSGLWSLCRHPNYVAEQSIWLTLYFWACYCSKTYFHWTAVGAVGCILLFQGSTRFTELISAGKYPEYKDYQARVGKFVPRLSLKPRKERNFAVQAGKESGKNE